MFGDDVTKSTAAFDGQGCHGNVEGEVAQVKCGFKLDGKGLGVALGFGIVFLEVENAGTRGALGDAVGFVSGDATHAEAFGIGAACATVAIDEGVDGVFVFFEELDEQWVFTDEEFRRNFGDGDGAFG